MQYRSDALQVHKREMKVTNITWCSDSITWLLKNWMTIAIQLATENLFCVYKKLLFWISIYLMVHVTIKWTTKNRPCKNHGCCQAANYKFNIIFAPRKRNTKIDFLCLSKYVVNTKTCTFIMIVTIQVSNFMFKKKSVSNHFLHPNPLNTLEIKFPKRAPVEK